MQCCFQLLSRITTVKVCDATIAEKNYYSWLNNILSQQINKKELKGNNDIFTVSFRLQYKDVYFKLSYTICKTSLQTSILSAGTVLNASFNVSSAICIVSSSNFCAFLVK